MMYAAPHRAHHAPARAARRADAAPGCARRASARACTRSSRRWTSSPIACGIDPIELRIRNEPEIDPETGMPFSSRNLVACLREGAERFGWAERDPRPAPRRDGRWLRRHRRRLLHLPGLPGAGARRACASEADGSYVVADRRVGHRHGRAHGADPDRGRRARRRRSSGCAWTSATARCRTRRWPAARWARPRGARRSSAHAGSCAREGGSATAVARHRRRRSRRRSRWPRHAFGAQFAEVRVDADTGEVARRRGCSASSRPAASSTRRPRARSSSAA